MSLRDLIEIYAINRNEMSAGLAAYQKGFVRDIDIQKSLHADGHQQIDSYAVIDTAETEIHLIGEKLSYASCSCHTADMDHLCRHGVALLRAISDHLTPEAQVNESERQVLVNNLLSTYQDLASKSSHHRLMRRIRLLPLLDFDPYSQRFAISFRISENDRSYVLKNLSEFANRIRNEETFSYGKWLSFSHHRDHFDDASQFYIDLICSAATLLGYGRQLFTGSMNHGQIKRYLYLTSAQFDQLFDFIVRTSGSIPFQMSGQDSQPLRMSYGNPQGDLELSGLPGNRFSLSLKMDTWRIYKGDRHHYLFQSNEMIRPDLDYQRTVLPLLKTFSNLPQMIFTENELSVFIASAEQRLLPYIRLNMPRELHDRLAPPPLKIHLRLDYPWPDTIRGIVTFSYQNISFNPLDEDVFKPAYRDLEREQDFLNTLYHYQFSNNEDELLLLGEDAVYRFLHDGLPKIMPLGDIDIEKRLSKIRPKAMGSPRLIASMSHGIIELRFDETLYDRETLIQVLDAYRNKKQFIRLDDETFLDIINPAIAQLNNLLEDVGLRPDALLREHIELPAYRAESLTPAALENILDCDKDANLASFAKRINQAGSNYVPLPEGLQATLRPYQIIGYQWFVNLANLGLSGILADDMGLGKTLQTIAFLLERHQKNPDALSLIVVPTSLIYNWQEELDRFAPSLRYYILSGSSEERYKCLANLKPGSILITSYATLRRDIDHYTKLSFNCIIADEAQYIKNSYTQNALSLKSLKATHRFALTGTPMENALTDLWSIMDFCMPGYLHSWTHFRNVYEIPITRYDDEERLQRLHHMVTPFLLRRIKQDVLADLPDKIETTLYTNLSNEESRIYQGQLALSQKTFIDSLAQEDNTHSRIRILALLMRLRQVCCSPALFLEGFQSPSSKLKLALDVIRDRHENGHQMILFSQFTSMLDLIAKELDESDIPYLMLTGQTPSSERMALVNRFQNDHIPVFLISLKAGGVGLNLTAADTVIHYDPWWNQSVENQATDRTHRIGQKETVHVIRLICKNTIEEKIMLLKDKKATLADNVVGERKGFFASLTEDDLRDLLNINEK